MNNTFILFSGSMKMCDLILKNYTLLSVLPRFDIKLGFGDKKVKEICKEQNVDINLFLMICNTHTYNDYLPSANDIESINIESLVAYLKKSHSYYINNRIKEINNKLGKIENKYKEIKYSIVKGFFDEYKQEIIKHFQYEEKIVFPYINRLISGKIESDFHIIQYEENHSNIDDKLSDLKSILIKYLPQSIDSSDRENLLADIFLFEEDLSKHTIIEDKILIPFVTRIEKSHEK